MLQVVLEFKSVSNTGSGDSTFSRKFFAHFESERKDNEKLNSYFARLLLPGEKNWNTLQERKLFVHALVF